MQKEKIRQNQNGITLIALIITIIVMLILVGVSVTVALNGGLFTTAKSATSQTQLEAEKEQLLELAMGAIGDNGKVDIEKLDAAVLADGKFEGTGGTYTSVSGNTFTVSDYGSVTVAGNAGTEPEESGVAVTLPEGLEVGDEFDMDADQDGTNETWIVLHAGTEANSHLNENEIEVISKNVMGEALSLGINDESAQTPGDVDSDGTANSDIDKAIYSFENSVNRLNSYCEGLIKIRNNGVRSVGSKPSDKTYVNTAHTDDSLVTHLADWTDAGKTAWNKYKLLAGTTDENSDTDFKKMNTLKIIVANNNEGTETGYWLASRKVYESWSASSTGGNVIFQVRYVNARGAKARRPFVVCVFKWHHLCNQQDLSGSSRS